VVADVPEECKRHASVECESVPFVQQSEAVFWSARGDLQFLKMITLIVATSFCNGDPEVHVPCGTHMLDVGLSLVCNSQKQSIFDFLLNVLCFEPLQFLYYFYAFLTQ